MNAQDAAKTIKQRVPMRQCAERYGFKPNRAGFIRCPFHQEKTPSLKCYDGDRGFSCYGCGEHGSVIDFVQRLYGLTFWQAVTRMNADFDLYLPLGRALTMREKRDAAEADKKRRAERRRREQAAEDAEAEYWMRFAWWGLLERIAEQEAPKSTDDDWSELWVFAMKALTAARWDLEGAEIMRMNYARECHSNP